MSCNISTRFGKVLVGVFVRSRATYSAYMANTARVWLSLAIFMVAGTLIVSNNLVSASCRESGVALRQRCSKFVQKGGSQITPSSDCCDVVKAVGVECLCGLLTDLVAKEIDTNKAVFVARTCGLRLQPGSKCGAVVVPNAA